MGLDFVAQERPNNSRIALIITWLTATGFEVYQRWSFMMHVFGNHVVSNTLCWHFVLIIPPIASLLQLGCFPLLELDTPLCLDSLLFPCSVSLIRRFHTGFHLQDHNVKKKSRILSSRKVKDIHRKMADIQACGPLSTTSRVTETPVSKTIKLVFQ